MCAYFVSFWYVMFVCLEYYVVNIMLAVCMLLGGDVSEKEASVSLVNCVQSAFL